MTLEKILQQCKQNYLHAINNINFEHIKTGATYIVEAKNYMTLGLEHKHTVINTTGIKEHYCMYNIYEVEQKQYYDPMIEFYIDHKNKALVLTKYINSYMDIEDDLSFVDNEYFLHISIKSHQYNCLFANWIKDLKYQQMFTKLRELQKNYDKEIV
jgi:hypothetical protein